MAESTEPTQQTAVRMPVSLIERIDRHAERLRVQRPGVNYSRADVVRLLLHQALDRIETAEPRKRATKRASTKRKR